MAGAEPPAKIARVAQWHTAKVRTHTHHHQPFAGFVQRPVFVRRVRTQRRVGVLGALIGQIAQVNSARGFNLF